MLLKIILLLNAMISCASFSVAPKHFNHWHCINLEKNIDKTEPYKYNIGDLSLITTFNDSGSLKTVLNTRSNITKLEVGKTIIHDNKLWWGFDPKYKRPPTAPYINNRRYATQTLMFDIPVSVSDFVDIGMSMNYANYADFLNIAKTFNMLNTKNRKNIVNSIYHYSNASINNIYEAPYTIWTQIRFSDTQLLVLYANILPLERNKTQCIITIKYKKDNAVFNKLLEDMTAFFERNKRKVLNTLMFYIVLQRQLRSSMNNNILKCEYPDTEKVIQLFYYISNKECF